MQNKKNTYLYFCNYTYINKNYQILWRGNFGLNGMRKTSYEFFLMNKSNFSSIFFCLVERFFFFKSFRWKLEDIYIKKSKYISYNEDKYP